MLHANLGQWKILTGRSSLDHLANNIASATFGVINEGKVRTADMGGKLFLNSELDKNYLVY